MKNNVAPYFLLLTTGIFLLAISPTLFSEGMFMDGVYYATIARNMSEGLGSFWSPQFTDTLAKRFIDHPPLVFYLQSTFFTFFGDHPWVERLYSLLCYIIAGGLVIQLWRTIAPAHQKSLYWLPLLLWLTVPKLVWGVSNNLLENTMMLFILLSLQLQIKSYRSGNRMMLLVAGFLIFLAFLAKGFTALSVASFPFFYLVFQDKFKVIHFLKDYIFLMVGLLLPFFVLFIFIPEAWQNLTDYFNIQILSESVKEQTGKSRLYIIRRVSQELFVMACISGLMVGLNKYYLKLTSSFSDNRKWIYTLLATALSGVLPIMVSLKQSTFYCIPVFPLFSIAASLLIAPVVLELVKKIKLKSKGFRLFRFFSMLIFMLSFFLLLLPMGKLKRDKTKLMDIQKINAHIGTYKTIGVNTALSREWSYYAYFYRYGHNSIVKNKIENQQYILTPKNSSDQFEGFEKVHLELENLELYQK